MRGFAAIKGNLVWEQGPSRPLIDKEVRIRIHASAVNRADILQLAGLYPPPKGESEILGLEMAGEIIETGPGVRTVSKGDKVCALLGSGGYASHCVIDERRCIPIPEGLSFEQAAAIPEAFFTAMANMPTLKSDGNILIRAAASGVGVAMLQLAQAKISGHETTSDKPKGTVFGLVGTSEKAKKLQSLFPQCKILDSEDSLLDAAGEGSMHTIINLIGGKTLSQDLRLSNFGATIVILATLGGRNCEIDIGQILKRNLTITGSTLRSRSLDAKIVLTEQFKRELLPLFNKKILQPVVDRTFELQDAKQAIKYVEQRKNVGKVVLRIP